MRGIILREQADVLVVQPTDGEVVKFGKGTPVSVNGPVAPLTMRDVADMVGLGEVLYDIHGRAVAMIQDMTVHRDRMETTAFGSDHRSYINGLQRFEIRATGPVISLPF